MNLFEMNQSDISSKNKTERICAECGNEIRKNDDKATKTLCGFCALTEELKCESKTEGDWK